MSNNRFKGIRYHKRINIGKFLRLNISKTGIGLSMGIRGLRYTRGPAGTFLTVGLPGSGLRYQKKLNNKKGFQYASLKKLKPGNRKKALQPLSQKELAAREAPTEPVEPAKPGLFAPKWEKALFKGVEAYYEEETETAIDHLRSAVAGEEVDLGAVILLAFLLSESEVVEERGEAIDLLEYVVSTAEEFPTPLLEQYMRGITVDIAITPQVEVTLPIEDALASTLLLVELYQKEGALEEAIGLLEEIDEIVAAGNEDVHNQVLALSLVELYLVTKNYRAIIECVQVPDTVENDIILGILFFYGRALQEQSLHKAAIQVFNKCLRRKKGLNPDLRQACRLWRAMSFLKVNQKARARGELERVLAESHSDELKRATLQALRLFWPQDFQARPEKGLPELTG